MSPTATIEPNIPMRELTARLPGAQRALFRKYHIGGCASCGFRPDETLAEVCARNENLSVDEVIEHLLASHESDLQTMIAPAEAAELMKAGKARLLDVRTREEFDTVHIEGSTFFTQELMHELGGWDRDTLLVFVDHQGTRSMDACAYFAGHGLENVRALRGGIDAWSCEVDPTLPRYELE
ncbi:MAG TPA: rhodanese-like domain-containing protein [Chthoniobacteraceae bacterium]|nr:rhodanese-like domain-containing protein [Chthoniobacteraceae bacterium]